MFISPLIKFSEVSFFSFYVCVHPETPIIPLEVGNPNSTHKILCVVHTKPEAERCLIVFHLRNHQTNKSCCCYSGLEITASAAVACPSLGIILFKATPKKKKFAELKESNLRQEKEEIVGTRIATGNPSLLPWISGRLICMSSIALSFQHLQEEQSQGDGG